MTFVGFASLEVGLEDVQYLCGVEIWRPLALVFPPAACVSSVNSDVWKSICMVALEVMPWWKFI